MEKQYLYELTVSHKSGDVILQGGDVFLNDKKMSTKYYNKGKRWFFIIPEK